MLFYQNMAMHVEAVQGPTDKSEVLGKRQQGNSSALWFLFSVSSSLSLSPSWGLNGHAQLPQLRDTLFWPFSFVCAPLCLFPAICPLSAPLAHISTHNTPPRTFSLPPSCFARPHPRCVTGLPFWLLTPPCVIIQVHHCMTCFFSTPPTKGAFDQRVTVCGSQKCNYTVVTFVWDGNGGLTSSLLKRKAQAIQRPSLTRWAHSIETGLSQILLHSYLRLRPLFLGVRLLGQKT